MARQTENTARWTNQSKPRGLKAEVRVLVADDHPVVRSGLYSCLAKHAGFKWVGEAADGKEAVQKTLQLMPDVVLMDLAMPRVDGFAAIESIRREAPSVRILALSLHTSREYMLRTIRAGAHGYISKEASTDELLHAILTVSRGETFFGPEVAQGVLQQMVQSGGREEPLAQLSLREREVLKLIAEGLTNKEMAVQLGIGVRTVETHRERIMTRLEINSVAGLTKFAIANGLVQLDHSG